MFDHLITFVKCAILLYNAPNSLVNIEHNTKLPIKYVYNCFTSNAITFKVIQIYTYITLRNLNFMKNSWLTLFWHCLYNAVLTVFKFKSIL